MGIKEVIETINRMQADGVIERYAIGGVIEAEALNVGRLREILARHGLSGKWQQFEQQFLK